MSADHHWRAGEGSPGNAPRPRRLVRRRPSPRPRPAEVAGDPDLCPSCATWWYCCYCWADPAVLRAVVVELARSHEGHRSWRCPQCPRLTTAHNASSTAELRAAVRRLAELHVACDLKNCPDRRRLFDARHPGRNGEVP